MLLPAGNRRETVMCNVPKGFAATNQLRPNEGQASCQVLPAFREFTAEGLAQDLLFQEVFTHTKKKSLYTTMCKIASGVGGIESLSRVRLFETPWTAAGQAPLSMRFPREEYWSELPFPSPGGLPDPGIKPMSPALAGALFTTEPPGKPTIASIHCSMTQGAQPGAL